MHQICSKHITSISAVDFHKTPIRLNSYLCFADEEDDSQSTQATCRGSEI